MPSFGWTEEDLYRVADRAYSLVLQGCYEEASTLFQGVLAADEYNSYGWNGLAACHLAMKEEEQALEVLNKLLRARPDDQHGRARRCETLLQRGRFGEAMEDLDWLRRSRHVAMTQRLELIFEQAGREFGGDRQHTTSPGDN